MTTYISSLYNNGKQHLSNSASFAQKVCQNKIVSTVIDGLFCYIAPTETAIVQGLGIAKYLGKKTIQAISFACSATKRFISKHEKTKQLLSAATTTANAILGNPRTAIILPALNQARKNICDLLKNMYKKDYKQTSYALLNLVENLIIISADNTNLKMILCINYITKAISELRTICNTYKQKSVTETACRCIKMVAYGYSVYSEVQEELHYFLTRRSIELDKNILPKSPGLLNIYMEPGHSYSIIEYRGKNWQKISQKISFGPLAAAGYKALYRTVPGTLSMKTLNMRKLKYIFLPYSTPHTHHVIDINQIYDLLKHSITMQQLIDKQIITYKAWKFNCVDFSQSVYHAADLVGNFFIEGFKNHKFTTFIQKKGPNNTHEIEISNIAALYAKYRFTGLLGLVRDLIRDYRKK